MLADPRPLSRRALALVLAGGRGSRLHALTDRRAKPAVYFGGKFRIIDFALSNCLNSGMRRIGVLTQYKSHSLLRHLQRGWSSMRNELNMAIESLVSGGCIISGASVRNSVLFSNVLVRSYSKINRAVVLPDVLIERGCRLTNVVIDRGCRLREGLVIGEDAEADAQRFHRTPSGVVLVTRAMLDKLN